MYLDFSSIKNGGKDKHLKKGADVERYCRCWNTRIGCHIFLFFKPWIKMIA
jgi:hypothetical protein